MVSDFTHGSTLYATKKLKGGAAMTEEETANAFNMTSAQPQQVQTALAAEQVTTADFRQSMNRGGDPGIIEAARRGHMKDVSLKKYT